MKRTSLPRIVRGGFWLGLVLACVALALVAGGVYFYYRDRVITDDAQIDGHLVPVSSRISGCVEKVLVEDNSRVRAGDVLVRIDPRDTQARVNQASAAVALALAARRSAEAMLQQARAAEQQAAAALREAQSSSDHAKARQDESQAEVDKARLSFEKAKGAEIKVAQATLEAKASILDKARSDLERMKPLAERQEISKLQFDGYVNAATVAESEWKAARKHLDSLRQEAEIRGAEIQVQGAKYSQAKADIVRADATVGRVEAELARAKAAVEQAEAGVAQAEAGIEQARANLEALLLQLSYVEIKAPIDGLVTARTVEEGQNVQPGQGMMILVPLHKVWVTANFKETQLHEVRPGQAAEVSVDLSGAVIRGKVDSIAGATGARMSLLPPENAVGNFVKVVQRLPVKILLDPAETKDALLRPGMNVVVTIFTR